MPQSDRQRLLVKFLSLGVLVLCLGILSYRVPGQATTQAPIISVAPQPDAPLQISSAGPERTNRGAPIVTFDVINKSSKPISAYAIRQDVKAGANSISSVLLIDLNLSNSTLPPGQRATRADTFEPLSDNAHDVTLSIDYVEFTDGTAWGGDSFKSAEQVAGQRAGAREAARQLIEVLNTSGPGAVIEAISSGPMKVTPPVGYSAKWAEGFNRGISVASARLKNAFKKGGLSQVERELRSSVTNLKKGQ